MTSTIALSRGAARAVGGPAGRPGRAPGYPGRTRDKRGAAGGPQAVVLAASSEPHARTPCRAASDKGLIGRDFPCGKAANAGARP